jgi:hypothetical protein
VQAGRLTPFAEGLVLFDTVFATETASFIHSFIHSLFVGVGGGGEERLSSATILDCTVRAQVAGGGGGAGECWG